MIKFFLSIYILLFTLSTSAQEISLILQKSICSYDIQQYDTAIFYAEKINDAVNVRNAIVIKAKSYFQLKKYDKALTEFLKLPGKYSKENSIYIAQLYAHKKDWINANKWLRVHLSSKYRLNSGVLKTNKFFDDFGHTKFWDKIWMETWYNKLDKEIAEVQYLARSKDYVEALDISDNIIANNKKCYKIYFERAKIYRLLKDLDNVVYSLKQAIKLDNTNAEYSFEYAKALFDSEKYKKATKEFLRTKALNNYYPRIDYFIAFSYFRSGNYENAYKQIINYRHIMPNDEEGVWLAAYTLKEDKQYEKALEMFSYGIKKRMRQKSFYVGKGECLYNLQQFGKAINAFTAALDIEPRDGNIYYMRGLCHIEREDKTQACRDWQKSSKLGFFRADDMISINCH